MDISYKISPNIEDREINSLFHSIWDDHIDNTYEKVLSRSFLYVCAYSGTDLVGYVNVAWDGDEHGFLLDTSVHKSYQRNGIGTRLVETAIRECRRRKLKWLHVDFLPHLTKFYRSVGFEHTEAGLIRTNK